MEPETYLGASDEHVHFNNQQISGEPLKLFGIDGIDKQTIWLDMKSCSGILDEATFSLLSNLEYISMSGCNFEKCSKAFAPLKKLSSLHIEKSSIPLETEAFENCSITSLTLQDVKEPIKPCFQRLNRLESISFDTCTFTNLDKDLFSGLESLKRLSFSNCKINSVASDAFDDLVSLEGLNIRDSAIREIDFNVFIKLPNLKFLSLHHNDLDEEADYAVFQELPALNIIHFDTDVYYTLNFESFPQLQTVKIGYIDESEDPKVTELIDNLESKGFKTEYVFCGTIDSESDMEECC